MSRGASTSVQENSPALEAEATSATDSCISSMTPAGRSRGAVEAVSEGAAATVRQIRTCAAGETRKT